LLLTDGLLIGKLITMIRDKSINKQSERPIQYFLTEEEFIRFYTVCIKLKMNIKTLSKEAVLFYLDSIDNEIKNTDGEE
jgi:hypothetical protein